MLQWQEDQIKEWEAYLPDLTAQADFDAFWDRTLDITRKNPLRPLMERVDYPSAFVEVFDISYCGFDETRVGGWLVLPTFVHKDHIPCLIQYHGFTGDRGKPADLMHWVVQGMAVLSIDCREQGGVTGNAAVYSDSGMVSNVTSKGILHEDQYYYRAVYMDCLKAIDFTLTVPQVDPEKIVIHGGSQGGALGMAVCALDDRPCAGLVNVPSNSDLVARVRGRHGSFHAVNDYVRRYPDQLERALTTLSYFDTMNMAHKIKCPIYASVGMCDPVCPPKCYYASYNRITSPKKIENYPFNEHDGAWGVHKEKSMRFLREIGVIDG